MSLISKGRRSSGEAGRPSKFESIASIVVIGWR
jgi:hypothetical protein